MIFVTVGHQLPFDRMIRAVDEWAATEPATEVVAQIGATEYQPQHIGYSQYMSPDEFSDHMNASSRVIAHAGVGTIIQALMRQKPLLVLTRLAELEETRSDHQIGTAQRFAEQGQLMAAYNDQEFSAALRCFNEFRPARPIGDQASPELCARIGGFLDEVAGSS